MISPEPNRHSTAEKLLAGIAFLVILALASGLWQIGS